MDTRNTTRVRTRTNAGTVQTTSNTEPRTAANGSLSNAANAAENGADSAKGEHESERENRDPSMANDGSGGGPERTIANHDDTQNAAVQHVDLTSEANGTGGAQEQSEVARNPTSAGAQAQVSAEAHAWRGRFANLEATIALQNERMDALMAMVSGMAQSGIPATNNARPASNRARCPWYSC